jgi:site-specific recombinase XerD
MTQYWRAVCAERCKHGSEGGCRKRAVRDTTRRYLLAGQRDKRHLAGILPYLRHSAATFLLVMGVHVKIVQELLGHSSISMTLDTYSHVLPGLQKEAMDKWNTWFDDGKGKNKETS